MGRDHVMVLLVSRQDHYFTLLPCKNTVIMFFLFLSSRTVTRQDRSVILHP